MAPSARSRNWRRLSDGSKRARCRSVESVTIYERGGSAAERRCEDLLRQAEARVEKITLDASGRPTGTEPLDVE